uniref:Uncharacterized protein n=1 Tax=Poecilia reticulata TaxID=8081 RepID=A0A3P9QDK3_POERE
SLNSGKSPGPDGFSSEYYKTPLHIASRLGKTEIVQLLLQHMAHPDAATTNGYTPLHISAREGQVETASVLLEAGTNILTNQGVTPLHLASQEGHTHMTALLISKRAQINVSTKVMLTTKPDIRQKDRVSVAEILSKNGANVDHQTKV